MEPKIDMGYPLIISRGLPQERKLILLSFDLFTDEVPEEIAQRE
jgi:hypothetical protein